MSEPPPLSAILRRRFGSDVAVPDALQRNDELRHTAAHASHRVFTEEPVDADVLETLLACAFAAPSKSDLQQACAVRVESAATRAALAGLVPELPWVGSAPVFIVFCGEGRRIRRICELRGRPFANDHLDAFFNATVDAALVMMNFIRAAEAAGLGCCPVSVIRNHAARVSELLGLPEHVFPVAGLAAGRPAAPGVISARLPLATTVHVDRYADDGLPQQLERYDRRRDGVQPIAPDAQRLSELYGVAEFYGWSEDKARQVSQPQRADFGAYVRKRGFRLD